MIVFIFSKEKGNDVEKRENRKIQIKEIYTVLKRDDKNGDEDEQKE